MPNGIFGQLPPGARGYLAGEESIQRRNANALNQAQGIFGLQQAMESAPLEMAIKQIQLSQLQNPRPDYKVVDNALVQIPREGTPNAVFTAERRPERPIAVETIGPKGEPITAFRDPSTLSGQSFPKPSKSDTERPYYTPVPTPEGVFSFNNRTGGMAPIAVGGKPVVRSSDSPALQSDLSYGKRAASEGANADLDQHEAAISAQENLSRINDLLSHLKGSQAITGLGAEVFKNVERAKVLVANSEKAGKKVSDTELLDAMMGQEVFPMIKSLGIGARGLDTPAEREFLRQVMSGTIQLNRQTLIRLTEMRQDIAQRALDRWNRRVEAGELERFFSSTGRSRGKLEAPKGRRNTDKGSVLEEADRILEGR